MKYHKMLFWLLLLGTFLFCSSGLPAKASEIRPPTPSPPPPLESFSFPITSPWLKGTIDESIYSDPVNAKEEEKNIKPDPPGMIESYLAELVQNIASSLIEMLETGLGASIDSIVYGRVGSGRPDGVNIFNFELRSGNPYGVTGAVTYSLIRSICYVFLGVSFIFMLAKSAWCGQTAKSREEIKSSIMSMICKFTILALMPYFLDIGLYIRDLILFGIKKVTSELITGGGTFSLTKAFLETAERTDSFVDAIIYLGTVILTIYFIFIYVSLAIDTLVCFVSFPALCMFPKKSKELQDHWFSCMLSNLMTPVIDAILLLIPLLTSLMLSGVIRGINIIQLVMCILIIPARGRVKELMGLKTSGERGGFMGIMAAMGIGRALGRKIKQTAGKAGEIYQDYKESKQQGRLDNDEKKQEEELVQGYHANQRNSLAGDPFASSHGFETDEPEQELVESLILNNPKGTSPRRTEDMDAPFVPTEANQQEQMDVKHEDAYGFDEKVVPSMEQVENFADLAQDVMHRNTTDEQGSDLWNDGTSFNQPNISVNNHAQDNNVDTQDAATKSNKGKINTCDAVIKSKESSNTSDTAIGSIESKLRQAKTATKSFQGEFNTSNPTKESKHGLSATDVTMKSMESKSNKPNAATDSIESGLCASDATIESTESKVSRPDTTTQSMEHGLPVSDATIESTESKVSRPDTTTQSMEHGLPVSDATMKAKENNIHTSDATYETLEQENQELNRMDDKTKRDISFGEQKNNNTKNSPTAADTIAFETSQHVYAQKESKKETASTHQQVNKNPSSPSASSTFTQTRQGSKAVKARKPQTVTEIVAELGQRIETKQNAINQWKDQKADCVVQGKVLSEEMLQHKKDSPEFKKLNQQKAGLDTRIAKIDLAIQKENSELSNLKMQEQAYQNELEPRKRTSYQSRQAEILAKRANINNFEQPDIKAALSRQELQVLYKKRATARAIQLTANTAGSVAGAVIAGGAGIFMSPTVSTMMATAGGSIGGAGAETISKLIVTQDEHSESDSNPPITTSPVSGSALHPKSTAKFSGNQSSATQEIHNTLIQPIKNHPPTSKTPNKAQRTEPMEHSEAIKQEVPNTVILKSPSTAGIPSDEKKAKEFAMTSLHDMIAEDGTPLSSNALRAIEKANIETEKYRISCKEEGKPITAEEILAFRSKQQINAMTSEILKHIIDNNKSFVLDDQTTSFVTEKIKKIILDNNKPVF